MGSIGPYHVRIKPVRVESRWALSEAEPFTKWDVPIVWEADDPDNALAMGHLHATSPKGSIQILTVLFMQLAQDGEATLSYEEVENWMEETGGDLLYDSCRRSALSQAAALDIPIDLDEVVVEHNFRKMSPV